MKRHTPSRWLRRTELGFFLAGFFCVGFCAFVAIESASAVRASEKLRGGVSPEAALVGVASEEEKPSGSSRRNGAVMGKLEIPAIALTVPILSDDEADSLLKGIGHIPGTAMPGGLGTVGLAGHRDTYFRLLARIEQQMDIRVTVRDGVYHYAVDSTEIVKPEEVRVLDVQSRPELTLVTCYPFHYVGAAPLRFIVHAHLLSVNPDQSR